MMPLLDHTEVGCFEDASFAQPPGTGIRTLWRHRTRWATQHPCGYSRQRPERIDRASLRNVEAFQYIASLIVGKETQQFVQLIVDVEGYRDRREKQLIQMAKRMADQVTKNGRRQTLEPMPSSERRIIHIALREHPAVKTESTGEEPYRKVMILPKED